MDNFMAVNENTSGIIGKFLYYSTSNILISKDKFAEIGQSMGLAKFKPAKESKAGAYRNATTAIKDNVLSRDGTTQYVIYCRNNKREDARFLYRELVKETLQSRSNEYTKLANIIFDKENEIVTYENVVYDADIDVVKYCEQAVELYYKFCDCYNTTQVDSVIQDMISRMQANKISIHGNLYFVPNQYLQMLDTLEDYIEALAKYNLNSGLVTANSMYVVDDEKQRSKMTEEFYNNYKRDIDMYSTKIQNFIDNGCESKVVIERWINKVKALQTKKITYEEILKRRLDDLNQDFDMLKLQSNELAVRNSKAQIKIAA